jgi:hypothetical protein
MPLNWQGMRQWASATSSKGWKPNVDHLQRGSS